MTDYEPVDLEKIGLRLARTGALDQRFDGLEELNEARAAVQKAKDKAVKAQTRLTEAMDRLTEVERESWPKEPRPSAMGIPPIVMFTTSRGTGRYTYSAIGISKRPYVLVSGPRTWYVTGRETKEFTWTELLEFMGPEGRRSLMVANAWTRPTS